MCGWGVVYEEVIIIKDGEKRDVKELNKRISEEIKRLEKLFTGMDSKTKKAVKSLIENAAFMAITLEDLQIEINASGPVSRYQNGECQWGTKKSPEVEVYNTMIKNHMGIIKQLTELMPQPEPKEKKEKPDAFEKLLGRGQRG